MAFVVFIQTLDVKATCLFTDLYFCSCRSNSFCVTETGRPTQTSATSDLYLRWTLLPEDVQLDNTKTMPEWPEDCEVQPKLLLAEFVNI